MIKYLIIFFLFSIQHYNNSKLENLSIEFQSTVVEIQKEVVKAVKLNRWPENKAKRVYNKAVSVYTYILSKESTLKCERACTSMQYPHIKIQFLIL